MKSVKQFISMERLRHVQEFLVSKDKAILSSSEKGKGENLALLQIWHLILGYLFNLIQVDYQIAFVEEAELDFQYQN